MRIDKITLFGITTYKEPAVLDLAAMGPGIIAIAGPNGGGKTSLLEAVPGAIYRQTPSRGSIATMATARNAMIEIAGENGSPFVIRLDIDNHSGRQEAVFFDAAGEPLAGPKVKEFDAQVSKTFPTLDVYLASFFASQTGVGSVLKMSRSDRRALFSRLLGLERLELMATAARERARATETEMTAARAALEAVRSGAGDVVALEASLDIAKENATRAAEAVKAAEADVLTARETREKWVKEFAEAKRRTAAYEEAFDKEKSVASTLRALEDQERELAPILARASEIRTAAEDLQRSEVALATASRSLEAAEREIERAGKRLADAQGAAFDADANQTEIRGKLEALAAILADAPAIKKESGQLMLLASRMDEIRQAGETAAAVERQVQEAVDLRHNEFLEGTRKHDAAARELTDAKVRADDASKRLQAAERSTASVPCAGVLEEDTRGNCPALVGHFRTRDDARKVLESWAAREAGLRAAADAALTAKEKADAVAHEVLQAKAAALAKADELRARYRKLHESAECLRASDRSAMLERAEVEAGALRPSLGLAEKAAAVAEKEVRAAMEAGGLAQLELRVARDSQDALLDKVRKLKCSDGMRALEHAERSAAELTGRLDPARAAVVEAHRISKELEATIGDADYVAEIMAADEALAEAGETLDLARKDDAGTQAGAVRLEEALRAAREAVAKADALVVRMAPMEKDLAEWRWLGRALGREGVQALELDAAGPRISGLANELLADAYGPRFQIRFETQAAMASGKGVKETFDVVVVDTERGREGNGEDLSGGEKVIVGEALGLAVGLFHAQAAGVTLGTVIRDETVGALDPENGERYLAMLRAFLRVGHVHQLLYVAHNPALVEMADAVVRIEDGQIKIN